MELAVVDEEVAVVGEVGTLGVELLGRVIEHRRPVVHRLQAYAVQAVEVLVGGHEIAVLGGFTSMGAPYPAWFSFEILSLELMVVVEVAAVAAIDEHQARCIELDVGVAVALGEEAKAALLAALQHTGILFLSLVVSLHAGDGVFRHQIEAISTGLEVHHPVELLGIGNGVCGRIFHDVAVLHGLVDPTCHREHEPAVAQTLGMRVMHVGFEHHGVAWIQIDAESHAVLDADGVDGYLACLLFGCVTVVALVAVARRQGSGHCHHHHGHYEIYAFFHLFSCFYL